MVLCNVNVLVSICIPGTARVSLRSCWSDIVTAGLIFEIAL